MTSSQRFYSFLFIAFLVFVSLCSQAQKKVSLSKGIVLRQSVIIKKQVYQLPGGTSLSDAPIVIEGDNITIDFNGAVINGSSNPDRPDLFTGSGIIIKSGRNITLKNLTIKGYKVGLMAKGINGLHINNSDFSYNFRQHLNSNRFREDLADWQSYHHNESDEWLRFGAGIYMRDCDSADIHDVTVTNGQCGLMLTNCNDGLIYNNNFSFNSGLGIGMYRSSHNKVMYNKVDWNVRGYSYGYYYRGQDSAGILVFEQSSDNVFAYNSVTHSGDGFFLWAGQSTLDTGKGGCNDNLIYSNDFSFAPTNAVEITFSRNKVINNIMHDCWHGIWAGFSYNTLIANNDFADNLSAIAIEHGSNNIITQNSFNGDKVALELWSNPKRVKDDGFLGNRDTRSRQYTISNNSFANVKNIMSINNTTQVLLKDNLATGGLLQQKFDSTVKELMIEHVGDDVKPVVDRSNFPQLPEYVKGRNAMLADGHPKGKKFIMMTEWGPYNFSYPILWWTKTDSSGKMYFDVVGPAGKWKVKKIKGVSELSAEEGVFPGQLTVQKNSKEGQGIDIELEYRGAAVESPLGLKYGAGKPYTFHYRDMNLTYQWKMKWYAFNSSNDPLQNNKDFQQLLQSAPVKTTEGSDISDVFGRGFGKGIPTEKIATISTTTIDVPEGLYRIGISASEMVRLYVDGKLVIDKWDPSKIVFDADYHGEAEIHLNGKHDIRVEQAQYGGYGMLFFTLQPVLKD